MYSSISWLLFLSAVSAQTVPPNNLLAPRTYCGYQHTDDYIRTNDSISIDEFPWSVQLLYKNNTDVLLRCSGSLISRRYVLTSAHCLNNNLESVRLGDYNLISDKDCIQDRYGTECSDAVEKVEIEEKIPHPAYFGPNWENDIALLRLTKDVMYSEYIRPICLPKFATLKLSACENLFTTGWGVVGENLNRTELKKKVETVFVPLEECGGLFVDGHVKPNFACAKEKHQLTCHGDGGAPLMHSQKNQWEQVGILVYKRSCGSSGIYLEVAQYINWIVYVMHP